jgi:hypothetical protein
VTHALYVKVRRRTALRHTDRMLHLRITVPSGLTERVLGVLADDPAVSGLSVMRGAAIRPAGDIILADLAREAANEIVDRLEDLGVPHVGTVHVEPVDTWISQAGLDSELRTPGSSADAVVWADVTQRAYQESELNWTYLSFMTLATMLASIAIIVDSQILVIGANTSPWLHGGHQHRDRRRARRTITGMDHQQRRHRPSAWHRLHLHTRQVVLHRGSHRGRRRRPIAHFRESWRVVRGIHFRHHRARRREHRARDRLRS